MNQMLKSIVSTILDVIKRQERDLNLENHKDKGLLLHNYEPKSSSCYEDDNM